MAEVMHRAEDIVALAKAWATKELMVVPKRWYSSVEYPRNSAVRVDIYSHIARGLCPYLPVDKAFRLLDYLVREALTAQEEHPFDDETTFWAWLLVRETLLKLVDTYLRIDAYDEALETANRIDDEERKVKSVARVIVALVQKGHSKRAKEVFGQAEQAANSIPNTYVRSHGIALLLEPALLVESPEKAVALSEKIKSQGPSEKSAFRQLIRQLLEMGRAEDACTVASYLSSRTARAQAYAQIVMAGARDKSQAFIQEINELLGSATGLDQQLDLLSSLAVIFFKTGDVVQANNVFARAAELANTLNPKTIPTSMSTYVIALASCRFYEEAREQARKIQVEFVRTDVLRQLADFLESIGEFEEARAVARLNAEPYWGARTLLIVAKAALVAGHVEQAEDLLNEIIATLDESDRNRLQPFVDSLLTQMLVRFRRIPEALQFLEHAGIDEYLKALANASSHFEKIEANLAQRVLTAVMEVASEKHEDYKTILSLLS